MLKFKIRISLYFAENIINEYRSIFVIRYVIVLTNFVRIVQGDITSK